MIRLALFDIDGTLIRTGGAGVMAFGRTFATEFGVPNATEEVSFAGRTDTSLVRELFRRHRIAEFKENFQRFFDAYVFYLHHLLQETKGAACAGVDDFIHGIKSLPEPPALGLLTGNIRLGSEIKLRHFGLWDHFVTGAFGDDHEDRNELAAIAQRRGSALLGESLEGAEILVVGDTPLDINCARSIGAQMLAVGTGGYTREALGACRPTWVVENLQNLDAAEICKIVCGPLTERPAGKAGEPESEMV